MFSLFQEPTNLIWICNQEQLIPTIPQSTIWQIFTIRTSQGDLFNLCYEYLPEPWARRGFYHTPAPQFHNLVLHLTSKCKNFHNFSQSCKILLHVG